MTGQTPPDYFSDLSTLRDPYGYFEAARANGNVTHVEDRDFYLVTGFDEAVDVLNRHEQLSSVIATSGPVGLPRLETAADDISDQIASFRGSNPMNELLVTYDGAAHTAARSLLDRLFVPSRLKANEEYMAALAERMVTDAVAKGRCELINEIAAPYVTLVIADLLGVPADDRETFSKAISEGAPAGNMIADDTREPGAVLAYMGGFFYTYIEDRRANPRDDVLTELATAAYPDGTAPDILEVVKAAVFLFAAGQDTSAKLLGNALRFLAQDRAMQDALRADPSLVSGFIEEMLRLEGSVKATFRLARTTTRVGDVEVAAGKPVVVAVAAANRDPERWEDPLAFRIGRPGIRQHVAFGRGKHTCVGAALARAEVRSLLTTFLARTSAITLSPEHHGTDGDRNLDYEPSFIIRGLEKLHVELVPA